MNKSKFWLGNINFIIESQRKETTEWYNEFMNIISGEDPWGEGGGGGGEPRAPIPLPIKFL